MRTKHTLRADKFRYATAADFGEIFTSEMHSLFILSLLLTGDTNKAEECFISALEDCLHGMNSFLGWARLWARRCIIKHAISLIMPAQEFAGRLPPSCLKRLAVGNTNNVIHALLALNAFERFAFVMSLLERQSDQDCSILLGCRPRDFAEARCRAISILSCTDYGRSLDEEAKTAWRDFRLREYVGTNAELVA